MDGLRQVVPPTSCRGHFHPVEHTHSRVTSIYDPGPDRLSHPQFLHSLSRSRPHSYPVCVSLPVPSNYKRCIPIETSNPPFRQHLYLLEQRCMCIPVRLCIQAHLCYLPSVTQGKGLPCDTSHIIFQAASSTGQAAGDVHPVIVNGVFYVTQTVVAGRPRLIFRAILPWSLFL